jgi:hypothetical protein
MAYTWSDEAGEYLWEDEEPVVNTGGIDDGGFNPVTDLPEAERINIGSDVYYRNADGTYTGVNTETNESFTVSEGQMSSLINPETSGNASMADLKGAAYIAKLADPNWVSSINKMFGSNLSKNDLLRIAAVTGGGLAGLTSLNKPNITKVGYQGGLPELQANRTMMTVPPAGHVPGSGGINYGGDVVYSKKGTAAPSVGGSYTPSAADISAAAAKASAPVNKGIATVTEPAAAFGGAAKTGLGYSGYMAPVAAPEKNTTTTSDVMTPEQVLAAQQNYRIVTPDKASSSVMPDNSYERKILEDLNALRATGGIPNIAAAQAAKDKAAGQTQMEKAIPGSNIGTGGNDPDDFGMYTQYRGVIDDPLIGMGDAPEISAAQKAQNAQDLAVKAAANPTGNTIGSASDRANMAAQASAQTVKAAQGGIMGYAHGGRYLQGDTDGMADELSTSIDGNQPAALSHGEFVIPADVVSHLGNGNSDAGAKKLYSMMDKIRQARTGTKKQGKQINPDKFMPGGLAQAYAQGGSVQHFVEGGVPTGTTGVDQTLAGWTGSYIPNMLAQTQALTAAPYQQYQGPLTAGASNLQTQAFQGAGNLQTPTSIGTAAQTAGNIATQAGNLAYTPQTSDFTTQAAQQYMNPYLQASLEPQLAEARRQSDITAQQNAGAMTKAGAFGGGRQAILAAENQRNLGTNLAGITGQGYNTAYTNAMAQFNADQARRAQENQFGANFANTALNTGLAAANTQGNLGVSQNQAGLANLAQQASLGAQQRGIESEGIAADKAAFEAARDNPYNQLKFQSQMLAGLPIQATNYTQAEPSTLSQIASGATTVDKALATLIPGYAATATTVR